MTPKAPNSWDMNCKRWALMVLVMMLVTGSAAFAADEPDLIFRRSTVFKWLTPNDKLATYGIDDPEVEGVACHFTVPEKGGVKGWLGVAEEVSDIDVTEDMPTEEFSVVTSDDDLGGTAASVTVSDGDDAFDNEEGEEA